MNRLFQESKEYRSLKGLAKTNTFPIAAFGFNKNAFILHSIAIAQDLGSTVIVVETDTEAKELYDSINSIYPKVGLFRTLELSFFDEYSHSKHIEIERLETLFSSWEEDKYIIISSLSSMMLAMASPESFMILDFELVRGEYYDFDEITSKLVRLGYERMDIVEAKGQFSIKGGLIDVFPLMYDSPIRLDFFGDELYTIKTFDIASQLSSGELDRVRIRPSRESLLGLEDYSYKVPEIKKLIENCAYDIKPIYKKVLEQLEGELQVSYPTKLLPFAKEKNSSFFDYISEFNVLMMSFNRLMDSAHDICTATEARVKEDILSCRMLPEQSSIYLSFKDFFEGITTSKFISFKSLNTRLKDLKPKAIIDYHFMDVSKYYGDLTSFGYDVSRWINTGYSIVICVDGEVQTSSVKSALEDAGVGFLLTDELEINKGGVSITSFPILNGFMTDSFKVVLLTPSELFGKKSIKKRKPSSKSKKIKAFSEIEVGDYVVHESYGIGRYLGIFLKNVDGEERDMIKIEYSGDSMLYVPVERLETLHKYLGKGVQNVTLHSLSSKKWSRQRERAKKAVEEVADELIDLYAKRMKTKGHAFPEDDLWQAEFEEMFPYKETEGQLISAQEIKEDMQKPHPMERLLCGDVGYGKTEVALRAIFKAVTSGKQACVLVPTTILAEQHYISMSHRLSFYPIEVAVLSRFKSKKEQAEIVKRLKTGEVDLVIGTHRLLSKDVEFKDLGLLVIDEEQRFGVRHKEKIKDLKINIDSLTMTATPIPRTLNMSLIGVKDLSLIEDPPDDRFPIQTYVMEDDDAILKESISREVSRNGQVYYVHNRVKDILSIADRLRRLCPDVRVCVAHGQLGERELESVLLDFMNGEYDVMVTTTIIETGVDIPNVNTIIINNCDQFGLSQLYQLRGRVGRSNRLAYAYLLFPRNKVLSEQSEKRLQAIKEFTSLGSGFKLSIRDLEIRGSGNVFGMAQSGHIEAIGYEMYAKLLEEALNTLKGKTVSKSSDCKVEFKVSAYISEKYIQDYRFRLEMYKKISAIRSIGDREEVVSEMNDRFGDLPIEALNLTHVSLIRSMAVNAGFSLVRQDDKVVKFYYSNDVELDLKLIYDILARNAADEVRFVAEEEPYFEMHCPYDDFLPIDLMEMAENLLLQFNI